MGEQINKKTGKVKTKTYRLQKTKQMSNVNAQKIKEEEKRKYDEAATAEVYAEFVAAFSSSPETAVSKTFVKAGLTEKSVDKNDSTYCPTPKFSFTPLSKPRVLQEYLEPSKLISKIEKKKSNLELFKEELELQQRNRNIRMKIKNGDISGLDPALLTTFSSTSMNDSSSENYESDLQTTNIYVGNVPSSMTERGLVDIFSKFGPLGSVRIVRSKHEDDKKSRCCAFISFMSRFEAERTLELLKFDTSLPHQFVYGWGRPVQIGPPPLYLSSNFNQSTKPTNLPFSAQILPEYKNNFDGDLRKTFIKVTFPSDWALLQLINRVAEFLVREGPMFEAALMTRENGNPLFRFLFDKFCPEHTYYRWRVFSLLQGDTQYTWSENEFYMFEGGSKWFPPRMAPAFSTFNQQKLDQEDKIHKKNPLEIDKKVTKKALLSTQQREHFENLLRDISCVRKKIAEIMVWSIDHTDFAEELVTCLQESLSIEETPLIKKVARLYVLNDLLYNSSGSKPGASIFRNLIERIIPTVMENFGKIFRACESKIQSEKLKRCVLLCLNSWQEWSLYTPTFICSLQEKFIGPDKFSHNNYEEEDIDGEPIEGDEFQKAMNVRCNIGLVDSSKYRVVGSEDIDGDPVNIEISD